MKVVLLAGGKGTRISEETQYIPKPMMMVGDKPILHHIMDCYMKYGFNDFIIAAGYKKESILGYFMGLETLESESTKVGDGIHHFFHKDFDVTVVDTGLETQTGGRLKRLAPLLKDIFMMTYGDGLSNVNLSTLLEKHLNNNYKENLVTVTAVPPIPRFGSMEIMHGTEKVIQFSEKSNPYKDSWINGGFFVINPISLSYIENDDSNWEKDVLPQLAKKGDLHAFTHAGFWHCIDTLRDLEEIRRTYKEEGAVWLK